ncbi:MAG: glutamate-1-semialdehyde 2,1-aminomutase [Candidatus Odinarchaeota archaeon]
MNLENSFRLFEKSKLVIPGGVNSPVRYFKPFPFFVSSALGSKLYDVDNNSYIDYCLAYGPLILGHTHPKIIEAVKSQLSKGTIYGAPSEAELKLAELICSNYPSIDMLRLVNSGTEATMHAIRTARGFTGKTKIIKFEGCYHGAHDYVLVKAGSGATTFGIPNSIGIPEETIKNTIVLPYNNIKALETVINKEAHHIAAVIIEPIIGNTGLILPKKDYLRQIRRITEKEDIILIFDEVITGFRIAFGGAQEFYNLIPDMTTLGKIMGGGFPIAAFGGKKEIMENITPLGKVYEASTLSGNPISVIAGLTTLEVLRAEKNNIYTMLSKKCSKIRKGIVEFIDQMNLNVQVNSIASMFQIFFTSEPIIDYKSAINANVSCFNEFHKELLKNHIFLPPSQFETNFISTAHSDEDIDYTLEIIEILFKKLKNSNLL